MVRDFDSQIATQSLCLILCPGVASTTQNTEENSRRQETIHKMFEAEKQNPEGKIKGMYYVIIRLHFRIKDVRQSMKITSLL